MRVLIVEPAYRRETFASRKAATVTLRKTGKVDDETLWYPPLGLMKLARFHVMRGDKVRFVYGCNIDLGGGDLFNNDEELWDVVYITTLFTYHFDRVVETVNYYKKAVGGTNHRIIVGGIMASLMPAAISAKTGIYPKTGLLESASLLGMDDDTNIDHLVPLYMPLDKDVYAINDTFYGYTTRGCKNKCPWCGVPTIEPKFIPYIDIKPTIDQLRVEHGDFAKLKLMDNNVLASEKLKQIVDDLLSLGYGRGAVTNTTPHRHRVVDFNQGVDASFVNPKTMKLLSQLNVRPLRIAFDRSSERQIYEKAVRLAFDYGFDVISNYMLYNFNDTPRDLYDRLWVNIQLNEELVSQRNSSVTGKIYSYPMRYAPIKPISGEDVHHQRDLIQDASERQRDWLKNPAWTPRFLRNVEIMKGVAHGAISPTPSLAKRTLGETFEDFLANLYMPESFLRFRGKHEKKRYMYGGNKTALNQKSQSPAGSGKVERFHKFIRGLLKKQDERFIEFHNAVSMNRVAWIRRSIGTTKDKKVAQWLREYVHQDNHVEPLTEGD